MKQPPNSESFIDRYSAAKLIWGKRRGYRTRAVVPLMAQPVKQCTGRRKCSDSSALIHNEAYRRGTNGCSAYIRKTVTRSSWQVIGPSSRKYIATSSSAP